VINHHSSDESTGRPGLRFTPAGAAAPCLWCDPELAVTRRHYRGHLSGGVQLERYPTPYARVSDNGTGDRRPGRYPAPTLQRMVLDLMTLVDPLMSSPVLYPLLAGLSSLDGVLPMIPSEAAVLAAGVFAHAGTPSLWLIVVATALGVVIGDHLAYGLGRSVVGPRLIGRSKRVSRAVAAAGRHLDRRAGLLIVTSRFLPGGRVTMNAACGTARLPLSRFSPASAVAALAWAAYIAGLGYLGGAAFVANPLLGLAVGLVLSFAFGGIVELIRQWATRRKVRPASSAGPGRPAAPLPDERMARDRLAGARTGMFPQTSVAPTPSDSNCYAREVWMKRVLRSLVTATTALAVMAVPAVAAAAPRDAENTGLQRRLDEVTAAGAVGALAEVRDEHGVWRGTSGVAELGTTGAVPVTGRFRAGSITKTFLATVVLQLADEGRLRLDDTVEAWLPGEVRTATASPCASCSTTPAGCTTSCAHCRCRRTRSSWTTGGGPGPRPSWSPAPWPTRRRSNRPGRRSRTRTPTTPFSARSSRRRPAGRTARRSSAG
jgi:membrane-associated protein